MKKHDITQDTLNFPSDVEDDAIGDPAWGKGDASKAGPYNGHAWPYSCLCFFWSEMDFISKFN